MRTRNLSFQLEKTFPGVFLLQGWFGGLVTGLVYTAALCFWNSYQFTDAVFMSPYFFILGSFTGVFKSIIMWVPYRLTRIQVRPVTRVVITSIGTGVFAFLLALTFGYGLKRPNDTTGWVLTLIAGGLPTAILVGSNVKPWELFTFGSIAVGDSRTGGRVGSKSVPATLGTFPLRFLSLIALAMWILACAGKLDLTQGIIGLAIVFFIPVIYLLYSAYVTFKSPHRILLLVSGIALNLPVGLVTYLTYKIPRGSFLYTENLPYVIGIGSAFLIAWAIFLIARLTAPIKRTIGESHGCLGSRFVRWQERHAQ